MNKLTVGFDMTNNNEALKTKIYKKAHSIVDEWLNPIQHYECFMYHSEKIFVPLVSKCRNMTDVEIDNVTDELNRLRKLK